MKTATPSLAVLLFLISPSARAEKATNQGEASAAVLSSAKPVPTASAPAPAAIPEAAAAPAEAKKPGNLELDRVIKEGIDCVYRMEFDKAEAAAKRASEIEPGHPAGPFLDAGIAWTRYVYENDQSDQSLVPVFHKKIDAVIATTEKWLKAHPTDARALMVLGSSYGISSRLAVVRKEWLKAYRHGKKGVNFTKKAVEADPNFIDAHLGLGMYDYYSDVYPRFIGVLAKLVLGGNRLRGIETLKMLTEKGYFSQSTAKILLVEIYTEDAFGSRDPEKAVKLMEDLRAEYPTSAMMHSSQLVALYTARKFDEVVKGADDYLKKVEERKYNPLEAAKGWVARATALWAQGKKEEALASLAQAQQIKLGGQLSRWAVWAYIRAGQIKDTMGKRDEALKDYQTAWSHPYTWEFQDLAKAGLKKPFALDFPGPITPP